MNVKYNVPKYMKSLMLLATLGACGSSLLGCEQQPESMFEQRAEARLDTEVQSTSNVIKGLSDVGPLESATSHIRITKQQAVARQPNCNSKKSTCQYFELNVLSMTPEQPWLTSIMWQTIARVMSPTAPLASQDETAKKTVSMLFNQIEYTEEGVKSLPIYHRIDTELIFNSVINTLEEVQDSSANASSFNASSSNSIATGYLIVRSKQHRDARSEQLTYVMLDMEKKLQLTIDDILLPRVSMDDLLFAFQSSKKEWLMSQKIEQKYHEDWPLQLSSQWYLDEQGVHMIYQAGELLTAKNDSVDLIAPYNLLQGLIKPRYIVHQ